MNTTSNADAEKTFCGRERPRILTRVSRQNPFGLRGSLPATVCSPRGRTSRSSRVRIRANSCPCRLTLLTCAAQVQLKEDPCLYYNHLNP
jgi:hypothetical protein